MDLLERLERIKTNVKQNSSEYQPGNIDKIFEIYKNSEKNHDGNLPIFIKPEPDEKKQKKFLTP